MNTETSTMSVAVATGEQDVPFTKLEQQALHTLRTRYQDDRDLFSSGELARLRFLRWLRASGRLGAAV